MNRDTALAVATGALGIVAALTLSAPTALADPDPVLPAPAPAPADPAIPTPGPPPGPAPDGTLQAVLLVFVLASVIVLPSLGLLYGLDQKGLLPGEGAERREPTEA